MKNKSFKLSGIIGTIFIFLLGAELHFFYDQSGGHVLSVLFGAVNESTWEHIKIFIAPYIIWAILELAYLRPSFKAFVVGKVAGLYSIPIGIIVLFYSYTAIVGTHLLWVDILISLIVCALAQYISYKVYSLGNGVARWFAPSLIALVLMAVMYFSFTAVPPKALLFKDPITGGYGIPGSSLGASYVDNAAFV
ncbi:MULTISPECIES: DUF6512 family protein [unclassified Ruminococcus]|uniref:DUF6512 family protein n=1 Tax=unclassified Ruminococcus TaxID=2608920 RepID=UPI00210B4998|nr:hypothetical protein [Ruminococcus sp. zg-924]MCQ4115582.1 hypothetical protein [Ruminococcus sp. zg-921]